MLGAVFELALRAFTEADFLKCGPKFRHIILMHVIAKPFSDEFTGGASEHFLHQRTDKCVNTLKVEHRNHVGKTGHQAAHEFLLLMQVLFHLPALADIHDGSLDAQDLAAGVAAACGRNQAVYGLSIFAAKYDCAVLDRALLQDFIDERVTLSRVHVDISKVHRLQILFGFVAQHVNQCGIHIKKFSVRSAQKNSLAKRGEEFREANFRLTLCGNVARPPDDRTVAASILADRLHPALELPGFLFLLQFDGRDSRPRSPFQKESKPWLEFLACGRLYEIRQAAANQMLEGNSEQFGEAAIGDSNFSVESQSEDGVIQVIDQIAIIVLRTRNHFNELVVLSLSSRFKGQLLGSIVVRM